MKTGSVADVTGSQLLSNSVAGIGGGIYMERGTSTWLQDTQMTANSAGDVGGALFALNGCTMTLLRCYLSSNAATVGSALTADGNAWVRIYRSTFSGNVAALRGGAVALMFNVNAAFQSCTFDAANTAGVYGGAVFVSSGARLSMIACNLSESVATVGGALYSEGGTVQLTGCTFGANRAADDGGGLAVRGKASLYTTRCTCTSHTLNC